MLLSLQPHPTPLTQSIYQALFPEKKEELSLWEVFPRALIGNPHFYQKELDVRMSCSYGPGRYDPIYEERGIDYPVFLCPLDRE